jgi:hypothetical protein
MTALDEPEAYSHRLDARKPCRGKVGKVTCEGWEDDDDGAVQAGPPMAR